MIRSVLFICLGNICRSPTAEGVLRQMAHAAGLDLEIDSAGTGGWHVGHPPHGAAIRAAAARGYDISGQRARQAMPADFARFDLILAMDAANLAAMEALRPAGHQTPLRLFTDYADSAIRAIPDPYYTGDFSGALTLIETAARGLISGLEAQLQ